MSTSPASLPPLSPFSRDYLRLTLEIEKHIPGYIDAYLGPPELRAEVEGSERKEPAALLDDLADLKTRIPAGDEARTRFVTALLRAIGGTLRILNGEQLDYLEEVRLLYDIAPQPMDESAFEEAQRELDDLLPGQGSLSQRANERRQRFELPAGQVMPLLELARDETRRRTAKLVDLVPGEEIALSLVSGQPWSAYNWYRGKAQSLVEFNTDVPISMLNILGTMAHEGYPGHHTEGQLKEKRLLHEKGYWEFAAYLLHSPAAVISEGIATTAVEIIFPDGSHHDWNAEVLLPAAGLSGIESGEQMRRIAAAQDALRYVSGNAAIAYHTGKMNREQVLDYMQTYGLSGRERAEKSFSFITAPLFRSYAFTYTAGYQLIAEAADGDKTDLFRHLLTEPVLPSQLADGGETSKE